MASSGVTLTVSPKLPIGLPFKIWRPCKIGKDAAEPFDLPKLLGINGAATSYARKSHPRALFNPQSAPQLGWSHQLPFCMSPHLQNFSTSYILA